MSLNSCILSIEYGRKIVYNIGTVKQKQKERKKMKIGEITTITKHYISGKGNEYQIVRIELIDIPEDMRYCYDEVMYGTINYKYITDNRLNTPLNLASMCIGKTIPEALERRTNFEDCEGMTMEEIVEYFKVKMK